MKKFILKSAFALAMFTAFLGCSSDDDQKECSQGLSGPNCDIKITPTAIKINKIVITQYPISNQGNNWDNGEDTSGFYPDIFFLFKNSTEALYLTPLSSLIVDAVPVGNHTFIISPELVITEPNAAYGIEVADYDGSLQEFDMMVNSFFSIYDPTGSSFPDHVTVSDASQNFRAEIYMTYEW